MIWMLAQQSAQTAPQDIYLIWGFGLFGVALVLLMVELFVPSGGLLALLCGVSVIGSIIAFFRYEMSWGIAAMAAYLTLGPILIYTLFKFWLISPLAGRMILGGPDDSSGLPEEQRHDSEQTRSVRLAELTQLIGAEGVSATALRPVGTVIIDGRRIDGMAESGIIESDTPIVVTDVYDNQIKVRPR